jgi:excisionase family DNA binding protein
MRKAPQQRERRAAAMTVREVANRLEISLSLAYLLISEGKLRATRHGIGRGTLRVSEAQLEEYLHAAQNAEPESLKWIR